MCINLAVGRCFSSSLVGIWSNLLRNFLPVSFQGNVKTLSFFCRRYDSVINRLYTGIQCYSCGMRFTTSQTDVYADHLDWHYRQNRTEKDVSRKITHRRWYYSLTVSNAVYVLVNYRLDSVFYLRTCCRTAVEIYIIIGVGLW